MASGVLGTYTLVLTADDKGFTAAVKDADGKLRSLDKTAGATSKSFARNMGGAFDSVAASILSLAKVATGVFVTGAFGVGTFVKAGSELQSLRASFESLTGSVADTNKVMQTLYQYGLETAFKNSDIQASAKMFLANGVAVQDLMGWMRSLGDVAGATGADLRGLALPLTQAIGSGKMMTQDWYQIINQGAGGLQKYIIAALGAGHSTKTFKDDLAAGAVTADVLRKALEAASAEGGMAFRGAIKQSETFNGRMSNLMEGITNVGLAVLGVDAATGKVNPGGVFDKLSKAVSTATDWLTENKQMLIDLGNAVIDNFVPAVAGIAAAFTAAKLAAIGFGIAAMSGPQLVLMLIVYAIAAVIAGLVFLQVKFNIFGKAWDAIKSAWGAAKDFFSDIFSAIGGYIDRAVQLARDFATGVTNAFNEAKKVADDVLNAIKGWIDENKTAITNWSIVIGTLLLPKITQVGIRAAVYFGLAAASAITTAASWVVSAVIGAGAWIAQTAVMAARAGVSFAVMSAQAVVTGVVWLVHAAIASGAWIAGAAAMSARAVAAFAVMSAQALIAGARIGAAWLLAMGPIGLIIAVVIGVVALIIANWEKVRSFVRGVASSIANFFSNAWNSIKSVWGGIGSWFSGLGGSLVSAGGDIINGLLRGLAGGKDAVINKIKEIASGALDAIKKFFGINSPSRVMAQMGDYLMQGMSLGMDRSSSQAIGSAETASAGILAAFNGGVVSPRFGLASVSADDLYGGSSSSPSLGGIKQVVYANTDVDMQVINEDLIRRARRAR